MTPWDAIEEEVRHTAGNRFRILSYTPVGGGSINDVYRVEGSDSQYFVKLNRADLAPMFAAEAAALRELGMVNALRVPAPLCSGIAAGRAYLVMEFIDLQPLGPDAMAALGEGLAELHGISRARYGWERDNNIGSTPQRNATTGNWVEFWRENRLGYQLELAGACGDQALAQALAKSGNQLLTQLDSLLADHQPEASLLHGDLWGGNAAMDNQGRPVLFDPALYYGDRETDLAMSELFGGFSPLFFEAYNGAWPLPDGYRARRRELYQLYHLLNHFNLFGEHYGEESLRLIRRLLARI